MLTKILTKSDQQCCPLSTTPWSPAIQQAYLIHWYWSLQFTAKKTERNLSSSLQSIERHLPPNTLNHDPDISLMAKLRHAQKGLKVAKREADKLRKQHLEALLNKAIVENQAKKTKALTYLIRAERNRHCYARFRQHTKPKAPGGLAYITVQNNTGENQPLLDEQEMETTLLEYSRTHFAQAEGFPHSQWTRSTAYYSMTVLPSMVITSQLENLFPCMSLTNLRKRYSAISSKKYTQHQLYNLL